MTIEINRDRVFAEVSKLTGYAGAKAEGKDAYMRLSVSPDDEALLLRYWHEAFGSLGQALRRVVSTLTVGDTSTRIVLTLSEAVDTGAVDGLGADIESYVIHHITAAWLQVARGDNAEAHAAKSGALLETIARRVHTKGRPSRPCYRIQTSITH